MFRLGVLLVYAALNAAVELAIPTPAVARQTPITERLCSSCRLRLAHELRLGTADSPAAIAATDVIARDAASGRFYLSQHYDSGVIYRFDHRGRSVGTVGRRGQGPGEFLTIMDLAIDSGRVFAIDSRNRRLTVLDMRDSVLSTVRLPATPLPAGTVVFPEAGRFAIAAHIQSPDLFGHALHTFDMSGNRIASFDTTSGSSLLPQELETLNRRLTRQGANIWSAHVGAYVIQKWNARGQLVQDWRRNVNWFAPWVRRSAITPEGGRITEIMDIHFDESRGLLWVLIQVPADERDWARGLVSERGADGHMYYGVSNLDRVYDTVIEAIRADRGEVIVSFRVEQALRRFLGEDRVMSHVAADTDGVEYIDVWRIVGIPVNTGGLP